jgi:hypothetical protein
MTVMRGIFDPQLQERQEDPQAEPVRTTAVAVPIPVARAATVDALVMGVIATPMRTPAAVNVAPGVHRRAVASVHPMAVSSLRLVFCRDWAGDPECQADPHRKQNPTNALGSIRTKNLVAVEHAAPPSAFQDPATRRIVSSRCDTRSHRLVGASIRCSRTIGDLPEGAPITASALSRGLNPGTPPVPRVEETADLADLVPASGATVSPS